MRRLGLALWWAGPWLGLAAFVWRQQGLEARLAEWVDATNRSVQAAVGRLADVAAQAAGETEAGVVENGN